MTIATHTRSVAFALGCALAIAACGSSGPSGTGNGSGGQALAWVKCLRAHGVPNFPDPDPDGRVPNIPSDIDTNAPAFTSAQKACGPLEPGGSTSGSAQANRELQLLAVARCMRKHGFPSFPDPTASPPPQPPPGTTHGNAIGGPGGYLALPPASPALTNAEAGCGLRLP